MRVKKYVVDENNHEFYVFDDDQKLMKKYYLEKSHGDEDVMFELLSDSLFNKLCNAYGDDNGL